MIWRWFWREWRSPSLLIVWLSLTLSVACVLALGNISSRMDQALDRQGRDFLAADRVLRSSQPVDGQWLQQAESEGLRSSHQLSFMTMTYANDTPLLASVKAVDEYYPLYGELETLPENLKPMPGQVLVAPRLLALLDIQVGQQLEVGDTTLTVIGELIQEPDSGFNPFETSPRILINQADIAATGAVQPGSRLTYRYMFAGADDALERFSAYLTPLLKPDQRWFGIEGSGGTVAKSLERAQQFLLLSAILTLLLSAAAVAVAMGHYCRSRYDLIAVLKTLGAGKAALRRLIVGQWLSVLLLAAVVGSAIGLLFEQLLILLLRPILPAELPAAGWWPLVWSIGALLLMSLLVGLRPYVQLLATLPARVLRREAVLNVWPLKIYLPIVVLGMGGLLASLVGFNPLWWTLLFGILILGFVLGLFGWGSLLLLRRLTVQNLAMRLSVNRLLRQPSVTISQLSAFSLSFMLLALLFMLRGGLLERWQQQLPDDSPNYFLMNINDAQVSELTKFLQQNQIKPELFYPVVRVRLTQINQQQAIERIKQDDPGFEAVNRELNLTWLNEMPPANRLVEGVWPPKANEVSMDEGIAGRMGVKLGDQLTFTGDTVAFSATVTSLRHVNWESLRPNFYFIFPPGGLDGQPQSWITSFRYDGDMRLLTQLNREFPTITLLDIDRILNQVEAILEQVSRALEVMVILVIACGFLLLLAQVQVGMRQRHQELVVYRTLGASRRLLRNTLWSEFALLGFVAGITATIGAEAALWLLQWKVFDFPWQPNLLLWLALPLICMLLLSLCGGWLGTRLLNNKGVYRHYAE